MKRSPLKRVSKKRQERLNVYYKLKRKFLSEHHVCERCQKAPAQDVHHKAGQGSNTNNVETWAALCRPCHRWVHDNAGVAREEGWLT
jgi:hypothetical protein